MTDDFEYSAFMSYSHKDERLVSKLHRQLETYRVPPAIASANGLTHRRLFPIFRDREETSASSDLKGLVEEALSRSRYLVVACSQSSFNSLWVAKEVQSFIDMGRADRIICCILDDPANIPVALQHSEPLAADLTKDGWNNAKLKIVSAMLSCKFDELKQRDLQRTHRRMAIVTAASIIGLLGASGLATYALLAEREANRQRELASFHQSQAEHLVGFMLGELRERLEPIGRLDVLDAVGDEVMGYFATQPPGSGDASQALQQALALRQVGEIRVQQGLLVEGLESFTSAMALLEGALPQNVNHESLLFEIAQLHFWIADAHLRKLEFKQADERIALYLQYSLELMALKPQNPDYRMEVAWAYNNLGTLAHKRGNLEAASRYFGQTLEIQRALVNDFPQLLEYQSELASTISWLAAVESARGSLSIALDLYRQELALHNSVAAQIDDVRQWVLQARAQKWIGATLSDMGRYEEAMASHLEAQLMFQRLVVHDPDNAEWALEYGWHRHQLAMDQIVTGQHKEALAILQSLRSSSLGAQPQLTTDIQYLQFNAAIATGIAHAELVLGEIEEAQVEASRALSVLKPHVIEPWDNLTLIVYGEAAYLLSEAGQAPDIASQALRLLEKSNSDSLELQFHKFTLAVNAGDQSSARRYRTLLQDSEFAAPLMPESSAEAQWLALASSGEK